MILNQKSNLANYEERLIKQVLNKILIIILDFPLGF